MIDKNTAQRYLSRVKSALKNAKQYRRSVITLLKADLQEYISDHPDAGEADLLAYFGAPEEYAAEYMTTMPLCEQKKMISAKKRIVIAVIVGLLAALLIWGIGVGIAVADNAAANDGYLKINAEYSQREG